mmetsp:Transcript_28688/g.61177  ORF Transcript_28688/g.61177 Transcript_28688/m.61177 type:complete len:241 (+) Transcript_28688:245-967(+)
MDTFVQLFKTISLNFVLKVGSELFLVLGVILLLEVFHVLTDMSSEDALTVHISIVILGITIVTRETLLRVRDVKSTIGGTLQGTEDTASSGSGLATNIQKGTEGTLVFVDLVDVVSGLSNLGGDNISINLVITFVNIIQTNLLEETTSTEQSSAVSSGVVLKSNIQAVTRELGRGSRSEDAISINEGVSNLADDLTVGETDDDTVLGRLVLVLCLAAKSLTLTVVGLSLATTTEFDLEAL